MSLFFETLRPGESPRLMSCVSARPPPVVTLSYCREHTNNSGVLCEIIDSLPTRIALNHSTEVL